MATSAAVPLYVSRVATVAYGADFAGQLAGVDRR